MTRACAGRVATAFTMTENPGPLVRPFGRRGRRMAERFPILFLRKRHVLIKLVNANLNLAWFSANFPRARQVCVLRHPCGQFESWRRLGWEPDPHRLLENRRLVEDHLQPFVDLIASARNFWERAGALWAATVHVIHRQTQADERRLIVAYEWLCGDPLPRFQELYRRLDLTWSPGAETLPLGLRQRRRSSHLLDATAYRHTDRQMEAAARSRGHRGVPAVRGAVRPAVLSRLRIPGGELQRRPAGVTACGER